MHATEKYLVQVCCQPALAGGESQVIAALRRDFNAFGLRRDATGFSFQVVSHHPLAYGALKDLADLLEAAIAEAGATLVSGVVSRVRRGFASELAHALGPLGRAVSGLFGWTGRDTLMYFHQNLTLDLALTDRLARVQRIGSAVEAS